MFKGFHVCIQVSDLDRSSAFYRKLGFSPVAAQRHDDGDVVWQYLRYPGSSTLLELLQFKTGGEAALPTVERRSLRGLNHIGFHVESLEALRSELESSGVDIVEQGARAGYRYLFARGPDGELIGFAEFE
jgi:catechol 2,3-dioxygenase-like lactoylglutathione lyase family enzyme